MYTYLRVKRHTNEFEFLFSNLIPVFLSFMTSWTGNLADPRMVLETFKGDQPVGALEGHR